MKKFFFNNSNNDSRTPFWQPWGLGGFLGRLLGFTLLLLALILLLRLFRNYEEWCDPNQPNRPPLPETPWHKPIEGGEEIGLPSPDDNKLPDFGELEPITDPGKGDCETYPGLLYIVLKSADNGDAALRQFAQQFSTLYPEPEHKIVYYCVGAKTCMVSVPEANRMEICSRLPEQITGIELIASPIERLGLVDEAGIPNDPALSDQVKSWHFDPIQARQAWTVTTGSPEIVVGIVDSYMDLNHPELAGNRCIFPYSVPKQSTDIAPNPNVPRDVWGHGTLVTATAVGNANNGEGSTGIAPSCKYIPVSLGTNLNTAAQAEGILYCIYNGADVINISMGRVFNSNIGQFPITEQVRYSKEVDLDQQRFWDFIFRIAEEHNTTIVWAAGNSRCYTAMDPSKRNPGTIRVSATDKNNRMTTFSCYGNFAELGIKDCIVSAPGVQIWNALPDNRYDGWDGTSFSAPIITGVVALLKSVNRDLTTAQIIDILERTSKKIDENPEIGGIVQIYDALIEAQATNTAPEAE